MKRGKRGTVVARWMEEVYAMQIYHQNYEMKFEVRRRSNITQSSWKTNRYRCKCPSRDEQTQIPVSLSRIVIDAIEQL